MVTPFGGDVDRAFGRVVIVLALTLLAIIMIARAVSAQDAIDLRSAVIHGAANPADLPITASIDRVEIRRTGPYRGNGILTYSRGADAWPDVWAMGLGDGGGAMQYTTWVCVRVDRIECGGFVQHWRNNGRGTGAPWLQVLEDGRTNYAANWAYDSGRWGGMVNYQPKAGDVIWIFLVAGNARTGQAYEYTVQARTNVVAIVYPQGDNGDFDFTSQQQPTQQPTTNPIQTTGVTDPATLDWIRRLYEWSLQNAVAESERDKMVQDWLSKIYEQNERIYADETKQHQSSQQFAAGGTDWGGVFKFLAKYVLPALAALGAGVAATN